MYDKLEIQMVRLILNIIITFGLKVYVQRKMTHHASATALFSWAAFLPVSVSVKFGRLPVSLKLSWTGSPPGPLA